MTDETDPRDWQSPASNDRVSYQNGKLDEVVGSSRAHLERMGGNRWFLIIGHNDGTETALWFKSKDIGDFTERRGPRPALSDKAMEG